MAADRNKIIIISVLGAALLGVGAWQFLGPKPAPATSRNAKKSTNGLLAQAEPAASNSTTPTDPAQDPSYAGMTRKDPFVPGKLRDEPKQTMPQGKVIVAPSQNGGPRVYQPNMRMSGGLPPRYGGQVLPPAAVNGGPTPENGGAPGGPSGYQLIGVVEGPRPVAVFRSASGQQTMVKVDGALGQGARVTGIKNGRVTVSNKDGSTKTIPIGGNSQ